MLDDLAVGHAPDVGDGHAEVAGFEVEVAVGDYQVVFGNGALDVQVQFGELAAQPVDVADEALGAVRAPGLCWI